MPDFSVAEHGYWFREFCKLEKELKGPDPQLATIYQMCLIDGVSTLEMAWRAGVGVGVWNVPTAEAIWQRWTYRQVLSDHEELLDWLTQNWAGIFTRRERRCVRTPLKMFEYLYDLASWVADEPVISLATYDDLWNSVLQIKFMGRYIAIKYLEFIRRYINPAAVCPDIRSAGGWSPVKALGMLYEDLNQKLEDLPMRQAVPLVEHYAAWTLKTLQETIPDMNFFDLQVMLCEYRTGYEHRHQYPGRSLDEELEYVAKLDTYWRHDPYTKFWRARSELFDHRALGEYHCWNGIRHDLGGCLRDQGFLWTDLRLDYCSRGV
jgi:hypothetical protein